MLLWTLGSLYLFEFSARNLNIISNLDIISYQNFSLRKPSPRMVDFCLETWFMYLFLQFPLPLCKNRRTLAKWSRAWILESDGPDFISSVQLLSRVWLFATQWTAACQLPCLSPTPGAYSNSCPLSWWCHLTISFSIVTFYFCLQSFPASGSFPMSRFFASSGQSIGVSASASVLPVNIQDWFPLGRTGLICLKSKGLSRVFSNTTI